MCKDNYYCLFWIYIYDSHVWKIYDHALQHFLKPEKFSIYWKRFVNEVIQLGLKSLFIVILMSGFMGAVLVIQTASVIESAWIPDYTVGFTVKQSMLLEFLSYYNFLNFSWKGRFKYCFRVGYHESDRTNRCT